MNMKDMWMDAHVAIAKDRRVTIGGNRQDASSVLATLDAVFEMLGIGLMNEPSRDEMEHWLHSQNRADEVDYLMEEY